MKLKAIIVSIKGTKLTKREKILLKNGRPWGIILFKRNLNSTVNKIYLERKKTYNEADFKIKCTFLKSEEIVQKIIKLYEDARNQI